MPYPDWLKAISILAFQDWFCKNSDLKFLPSCCKGKRELSTVNFRIHFEQLPLCLPTLLQWVYRLINVSVKVITKLLFPPFGTMFRCIRFSLGDCLTREHGRFTGKEAKLPTVSNSVWIKKTVFTCERALAAAGAATSGAVGELGPRGESAIIFASHSASSHLGGQGASPPQALCHIGRLAALPDTADSCKHGAPECQSNYARHLRQVTLLPKPKLSGLLCPDVLIQKINYRPRHSLLERYCS